MRGGDALNNKAYYWYRPHPFFGELYPGKVLDLITDAGTLLKYLPNATERVLAKKFFPNGLSPHGFSMLPSRKMDAPDIEEPITEIVFELVRQLHFPDAPSRLISLYASESIRQSEQWYQLWIKNFGDAHGQIAQSLWEIEFDTEPHLYDATFLYVTSDSSFSYVRELENAHKYWGGNMSRNPLPELLIPYPITVTRMIRDIVSK